MNLINSGAILVSSSTVVVQAKGTLTVEFQTGLIGTDNSTISLVNYGTIIFQPSSVDNYQTVLAVPLTNNGNSTLIYVFLC